MNIIRNIKAVVGFFSLAVLFSVLGANKGYAYDYKDPDAVQAAMALLIHHQSTNADTIAKEISSRFKKSAAMQTALGRAYYRNNMRETTRKYLAKAYKADSTFAPAYILNGDMYAGWAVDSACIFYNKAIACDSLNPDGYIHYASAMSIKDMDKAKARLEDLRRVKPDYPVDIEIANLYNKRGDDVHAAEAMANVDVDRLSMNQLAKYGQNLYWSNNDEKSIDIAKRGIKRFPQNKGFNRLYFWSATRSGAYRIAKEQGDIWFNATPSDSLNSIDLFCMGSTYLGLGNNDKAFDTWAGIAKKDDYFAPQMRGQITRVVRKLVDEKKQQGNWNSAIAMYERFMKTYPSTDGAYQLYQLSNIYRDKANEENGEEKQATIRKMFEIYEEIENKYPRWENISYVLYTHARWTYAYFDRDNSRSLARPYYEKLYEFLSAKDEQTEQEKAMIVEACQYLGSDSYFQHKNLADARVWWRRILLFDPENENAREALDKIKK